MEEVLFCPNQSVASAVSMVNILNPYATGHPSKSNFCLKKLRAFEIENI